MSPDVTRKDILDTLAADIVAFASLQSDEGLATLVGFFHLAGRTLARIALDVRESGVMALNVEVETEPPLA